MTIMMAQSQHPSLDFLKALGRPSDADSVSNLIRRFDLDKSGRIDWSNGEFLLVIAMLDVVDVSEIDDFVFTAGFKTFDQDSDNFITRLELHVVIRLFLPMDVAREDAYVDDLIKKMDVNKDGKVGFEEFVKYIKEAGTGNILLT